VVVDVRGTCYGPYPLLAKLEIVNLTNKTQAPDRVVSRRAMYVLTERGCGATHMPPKKIWANRAAPTPDDTRHAQLFLSDASLKISTSIVPYCPAPLSFIQGYERGRRGKAGEGEGEGEGGS
jgi:hypothetical protein